MTSTITLVDDAKEIRERHLKYIAEITKDLAPPKFANLTEDQQDFLDRRDVMHLIGPCVLKSNRRMKNIGERENQGQNRIS